MTDARWGSYDQVPADADVEETAAAAAATGRPVVEASWHRWHPRVRLAQERLPRLGDAGETELRGGSGWLLPLEQSRRTAAVLDAAFAGAAAGGEPVRPSP